MRRPYCNAFRKSERPVQPDDRLAPRVTGGAPGSKRIESSIFRRARFVSRIFCRVFG